MTAFEDREKRRAASSLTRRLREHAAAVASGAEDVADHEPFAAEFIAALWGQGWRPIAALRPYQAGPAAEATVDPETLGDMAAFRAKAAAHAALIAAREAGKAPDPASPSQRGTTE